MRFYADTSALAKLFIIEDGSAQMTDAMRTAAVLATSSITYVELWAAVAAAARARRTLADEYERFPQQVDDLWEESVSEVALSSSLIREAARATRDSPLAGYDAVHLASLRRSGTPEEISFACWDNRLREAARNEGYSLFPLDASA